MKRRDMTERERLLLLKMWPHRETWPITAIMQALTCSTKTLNRFVRECGLPLRKPHRRKVFPLPRCGECGRRVASRHSRRCRVCFERPAKRPLYRCACGGRATSPQGHPGCRPSGPSDISGNQEAA